jgi:hypothetical protein
MVKWLLPAHVRLSGGDTGYWILDSGYLLLDSGYLMLVAGYWILDAGKEQRGKMVGAGHWSLELCGGFPL